MSVFDNIPRIGKDPPHQDEGAFAYLNRSNRIEATRVRTLVEAWFEAYPVVNREPLVARFWSPIDEQHKSAFFELFLHQLMLSTRCTVVAIEPGLPHTSRSPDFLVQSPDGDRFYLEAVMATGQSREEAAAQQRLNQALAAIDKTPSPAHFLDLSVHGVPGAPIAVRRLTRELRAWIAGLPEGNEAIEAREFHYDEHGANFSIRAWPRGQRDEDARAIGVRHFPVRRVQPPLDLRSALESKASRYGRLEHPYVVAINPLRRFTRESDIMDALLGTSRTQVRISADGAKSVEEYREPDGVWVGPRGPRKTGLSGVLSTETIDPWDFAHRRARLVHNPWATNRLPHLDLGIDLLVPHQGIFKRTEGGTFAQIFGLDPAWPELPL